MGRGRKRGMEEEGREEEDIGEKEGGRDRKRYSIRR